MKITVLVNTSNLYFAINKKYPGNKLDYGYYLNAIGTDNDEVSAAAYGIQMREEATGFITCLNKLDYTTNFASTYRVGRKMNWDCAMSIDAVGMVGAMDVLIIGSNNADLLPLVEYMLNNKVKVQIVACDIGEELLNSGADCIEITEDYLEVRKPKNEGVETANESTNGAGESAASTESESQQSGKSEGSNAVIEEAVAA